jgi:hypothetical protein
MYGPSAKIGPVELEDLFREVDAENVDFHDEPPHVRVAPRSNINSAYIVSTGK